MRFFVYIAAVAGVGAMVLGLVREAVLLQNSLAEASTIKGGTLYKREKQITFSPPAFFLREECEASGNGNPVVPALSGSVGSQVGSMGAIPPLRNPDAIPDGAIPDGAIPDGALPSGAMPSGALPDGVGTAREMMVEILTEDSALSDNGSVPNAFNLKAKPALEEDTFERLSGFGEGDSARAAGYYRKAMKARSDGNQELAVKFYVRALEESREILIEPDGGLADAALKQARLQVKKNPGETATLVRLAYLADILGTREESAEVYSRLAMISCDTRVSELSIRRAEAASYVGHALDPLVPLGPSEPVDSQSDEIKSSIAGVLNFDPLGQGTLSQVDELGDISTSLAAKSETTGESAAGEAHFLEAAVKRGDFVMVEPDPRNLVSSGFETSGPVFKDPPSLSDEVEKAIDAFRGKNGFKNTGKRGDAASVVCAVPEDRKPMTMSVAEKTVMASGGRRRLTNAPPVAFSDSDLGFETTGPAKGAMPAAMAGMRRIGDASASGISHADPRGLISDSLRPKAGSDTMEQGALPGAISGNDGYRFLQVFTISRDNDTFVKRFSGVRNDGVKAVGALEISGHWTENGLTSIKAACGALGARGERAVSPSDREYIFTGSEGYIYRVKLLDIGRDEARVAVEVRNISVPGDARG